MILLGEYSAIAKRDTSFWASKEGPKSDFAKEILKQKLQLNPDFGLDEEEIESKAFPQVLLFRMNLIKEASRIGSVMLTFKFNGVPEKVGYILTKPLCGPSFVSSGTFAHSEEHDFGPIGSYKPRLEILDNEWHILAQSVPETDNEGAIIVGDADYTKIPLFKCTDFSQSPFPPKKHWEVCAEQAKSLGKLIESVA